MPTVLRLNGFEIVIRLNDHDPPHVHVFRAGVEAKVLIGNNDIAPRVMRKTAMTGPRMIQAVRLVGANQDRLLTEWRKFHA